MEFGAITAVAGAAFGAMLSYLVATRQSSGRVATTDADRLWDQNQVLIAAYVTDNTRLREQVHELEKARHASELAERECDEKYRRLADEMQHMRGQVSGLVEIAEDTKREKGAAL